MKAWQYTGAHRPLVLNEIARPAAGPGQVVVEVRAAGMCHSDVGALESEDFVPFPMPNPVTLGHEIAGVVSEVGEGVGDWRAGDRVVVLLGPPAPIGFARDGGYQSHVLVTSDDLVAIPEGVSDEHAAIATDAGVTAYLAVHSAGQVASGDRVGIVGYGGLGQLGAQIAIALGAEVSVVEVKRDVWEDAERDGAVKVVADVAELAADQLDVIIDFAGFGTTGAAVLAVKPFGRIVQIGLGRQEATIDVWALVNKNVTLRGALGGSREELVGVLDLFAAGRLDPLLTRVGFDDIPDTLTRFARGEVRGRAVAVAGA